MLILLPFIQISCNMTRTSADLMITNAIIYTVDENFSTAAAVVVGDGKILATGDEASLLDRYEPALIHDAGGAFVYPGFIDAHCHFLGYGINKLRKADLNGALSYREVIQRVVEHAGKLDTEWILGRGWDQNDWDVKAFPDRQELDELFPDRPVVLIRVDGHASLANGEALRRAGITATTKVEGGEVILKDGIPTGILIDNAMELVNAVIPEDDEELKKAALREAENDCFAVGLTSVTDAGLGVETIRMIDALQQSGRLKMKINAMLSATDTAYPSFMRKGVYRTERLHVNSVKLYADGALGSRGACMLEPYADDPGNYGLIMYPENFYRGVIENALAAGFQVNTHAIGDSGNRYMLDLYAEYLRGPNDRRWRIEHAQIVHEDDFEKFGAYNIIPSIQSTHATSDMYWAGDRIGPERMKGAYAYRRLLEANGWFPNGTDFPIENISPIYTFYAAVVRKDLDGYPPDGFQPADALSREEALRSITIWAAMGGFEEDEKGSIEPGKAADMVITDRDLMFAMPNEIPGIKVLNTFINGEMVYRAGD